MRLFGNITIGADPELFLVNPNSGTFISAHEYVKGTKETPFVVDKGAVQLDGVAAEFNIDPCKTADEFVDNIGTVWSQLADMTNPSGYTLTATPVADFDPVYFDQSIPFEQKVLGCDPDYDAWLLVANSPPQGNRPFRTGSGHIHVGWGSGFDCFDYDHFQQCAEVARQLDYALGTHSLMWDPENRRRELYGRAGAFRPKPYGMEYRVLSNAWLQSELLQRWVFAATMKAMSDLDEGIRYEDFFKDAAQRIINENDTEWYNQPGSPRIDGLAPPPGYRKAA